MAQCKHRSINGRRTLLSVGVATILSMAALPIAAESLPSDSYSALPAGVFRHSSGPEVAGTGYMFVCDGTAWQPVLSYNDDSELTQLGNPTRNNGDILRFNSSICTCAARSGLPLWTDNGTHISRSRFHVINPGETLPAGIEAEKMLFWYPDRAAFRSGTNVESDSQIGLGSFAHGMLVRASGVGSVALGSFSSASGDLSVAMGNNTHANSFSQTSFGRYSMNIVGDLTNWVETDALFEIGNGTSISNRSNAFTVLKNGNTGIGTHKPQSALHIPDGKYLQAEDNNAGPPSAADCDHDGERGRISLDTTNFRLYVCMGAARGWDHAVLVD